MDDNIEPKGNRTAISQQLHSSEQRQRCKTHNEQGTDAVAQAIIQAIDTDKSINKQLLFVCGDFNGAKSKTLCNQLQVKQIDSAPTRKGNLLDPNFTNAPNC